MGLIYNKHGRITIEVRSESFILHPDYGYTRDGNNISDDLGDFGKYWRECAHPEFLSEDLDDLINALLEIKKDKKY
jgi:hypothetical protein